MLIVQLLAAVISAIVGQLTLGRLVIGAAVLSLVFGPPPPKHVPHRPAQHIEVRR